MTTPGPHGPCIRHNLSPPQNPALHSACRCSSRDRMATGTILGAAGGAATEAPEASGTACPEGSTRGRKPSAGCRSAGPPRFARSADNKSGRIGFVIAARGARRAPPIQSCGVFRAPRSLACRSLGSSPAASRRGAYFCRRALFAEARTFNVVIAGLDPAIHSVTVDSTRPLRSGCRVEPPVKPGGRAWRH